MDYFNYTNISLLATDSPAPSANWVYTIGIPFILIVCTLSMIVNVRVLASVQWIRRPLSATLYISLSLAAADAFTSALLCFNLIINSYIQKVWAYSVSNCYAMSVEALRLGGIVTTVLHLTLLACNHYLGIVKPLRYPSLITHRKTSVCLLALWVLPPVYFFIYFVLTPNGGFRHKTCSYSFLLHLRFRLMFTSMLVVPLLTMTFIYTHILWIVRRQQRAWAQSAERGSSCRHRGPSAAPRRRCQLQPTHHGAGMGSGAEHRRHQQMVRNVKAMYTTLLILGSFVVGLLPASVTFVLTCEGCLYSSCPHGVFWFVNLLVVVKTLVNPIIYGARMHEIKEASRRMRAMACRYKTCTTCRWCLCWLCCGGSGGSGPGGSGANSDSQQLHNSGSSWRGAGGYVLAAGGPGARTPLCRVLSTNGNPVVATNNSASTIL